MRHARVALALPVLATLAPAPALTAPVPPPVHARYGPLTQCLAGYAIAAGGDEAVMAMEDGISLVGDRESLYLGVDRGDPYRAQAQASAIEVAHLGAATRYERVYGGSTPERRFEYLLPARPGERPVLARSLQFDGSERDLAILGRVSRMDPHSESCGAFAAPAFRGETPDALYWRPVTTAGPAYRCQNGIGYEVREGETVQLQWRALISVREPAARILTDGVRLTVEGPITPRGARTSFPLASYRQSIGVWAGRSVLSLWPPQVGMSRAALMRLPPEQRYMDGINIEFPAGSEAAARAFATRLEFVDRADPRCLSD